MSELEVFAAYFRKHPYPVKPYANMIGYAYAPIWRQPTLYIEQLCPREVVDIIRQHMKQQMVKL